MSYIAERRIEGGEGDSRRTSGEEIFPREAHVRFRKVSHEKQLEFTEQVREVKSAAAALDQPTPAVEKARALLQNGEKPVDVGQKYIKIADRSEHG